jgi:hypothetical protein
VSGLATTIKLHRTSSSVCFLLLIITEDFIAAKHWQSMLSYMAALQALVAWRQLVVIRQGHRKGAVRLAASRDAWWLSVCWQRWAAVARAMQGSRAAELRGLVQQRAVLG